MSGVLSAARHLLPAGPAASAAVGLAGLVWPVGCAGGGTPDVPLCPACVTALAGAPPPAREVGGLLVTAGAVYEGRARELLLAWKERGRHDLAPVLLSVLRRGAEAAVLGAVPGPADGGGVPPRVALVPVPSAPAAVRARGGDLVADLARRWALRLRARGVDARVVPVLRLRRGAGDQVGRGAHERRRARAGALVLRGRAPTACLLVDDVVTTGATLGEAARVVRHRGGTVVGAATVLSTPPPTGAGRRAGAGRAATGSDV